MSYTRVQSPFQLVFSSFLCSPSMHTLLVMDGSYLACHVHDLGTRASWAAAPPLCIEECETAAYVLLMVPWARRDCIACSQLARLAQVVSAGGLCCLRPISIPTVAALVARQLHVPGKWVKSAGSNFQGVHPQGCYVGYSADHTSRGRKAPCTPGGTCPWCACL